MHADVSGCILGPKFLLLGVLDAARLLIRTRFRDPARTHGLPMSFHSLGRALGHAFVCFKLAPYEKKRG